MNNCLHTRKTATLVGSVCFGLWCAVQCVYCRVLYFAAEPSSAAAKNSLVITNHNEDYLGVCLSS
jgi:hypothetical protein